MMPLFHFQHQQLIKTEPSNSSDDRQNNNNKKNNNTFHKRCPFCGLLFHHRTKLGQHFAQRHSDQIGNQQIDIDELPQTDEMPLPSTTIGMDLLLQSVMGMGAAAGAAETTTMMAPTTNNASAGPLDLSVGSRLLVNGNSNPYEYVSGFEHFKTFLGQMTVKISFEIFDESNKAILKPKLLI